MQLQKENLIYSLEDKPGVSESFLLCLICLRYLRVDIGGGAKLLAVKPNLRRCVGRPSPQRIGPPPHATFCVVCPKD